MANVELLPPNAYTPRYGIFAVSPDGTVATFAVDTRKMPNGEMFPVRIAAFDKPAGAPGAIETTAMPMRRWIVRNGVVPVSVSVLDPFDGACRSSMRNFESEHGAIFNINGGQLEQLEVTWKATHHWPNQGATITFEWPRALGGRECRTTRIQGEPLTGFPPLFPELL